ncbi:hypothetical protein DN546_31780, partial [Burkholderia multivorans]
MDLQLIAALVAGIATIVIIVLATRLDAFIALLIAALVTGVVAGQDLLAKADSDIAGPEDLAGKKVCSVDGSTPAQNIQDKYTDAELVTYDTYSKCVTDLQSGAVDAVTTDDAI